jgi:hypothetical protein
MRRLAGIVLLLLAPAVLRAGDAPEALLPATTQVYLRWDGVGAHGPAYARTALGQTLRGDTGAFLGKLFSTTQDALGGILSVEQLLGGVPPEELQKLQANAAEATRLLPELGERGVLVAAELTSIQPPQGRAFLIIPEGGAKPGPLFGAVRLALGLSKTPVTEAKIEGRSVSRAVLGPVRLAWWAEGAHAVVYLGTDSPESVIKDMHDGKPQLTSNPLFRRVADFKKFETAARAFVDARSLVKLAGKDERVAKLLDELGLNGMGPLVLYTGFDGEASRSLTEWELPGPRKGLLRLLGTKPFRLEDVPPLPPDVVSWSMTNLDAAAFYDVGLKAIEQVVALASPDEVAGVKGFGAMAKSALGVDLRADLLGSLGDKLVLYTAPSEGPFTLGQVVMLKVKDGKKLQVSLDQAVKALLKLAGGNGSLKKRTYHGVEVREVHVRQPGFIFLPTYAVHDGWLVVAFYPQPVHGFIARSSGGLERWQPDSRTRAHLDQLPKEFVSVSYTDPRPTLRQVLSLAPLIAGSVRSFTPDMTFEVDSIPNAQEVTRRLFPNVSATTDDGKTLRVETRESLALPFELSGIDSLGLYFFVGFARLAEAL